MPPCLYCKGNHLSSQCPVNARALRLIKIKHVLSKPEFYGSAPAPFIGRFGYPHINVGILAPPFVTDAQEYDAPKQWVQSSYQIPKIVDLRSSLVQSKTQAHIKEPSKLVEMAQLVGMADKPVDVEVQLSKIPKFSLTVDSHHAPMGPSSDIVKAELTSNPSIPTAVDKVVSDIDLLSVEGMLKLYGKGFAEYELSKILSVGVLGLEKNRRLVPTRWSITATDDILGKHLHKKILDCVSSDVQAYFGSYLGNYYLILFLDSCWSYELFEIALPGVYDAIGGVSTDYEGVLGRKDYAESCAGGYYTVRLAILEKLAELKRQTSALVFRFITNEYTMPLGVWVTREAARKALQSKPITFTSKELAITYAKHFVKRKFGYDITQKLECSFLLSQRKICEF